MNAIHIRRHLTSQVVDLPELAPLVGKTVEIIVVEESDMVSTTAPKAGSARGAVQMSADFDAPLDDFADYM
jgi:hypothetical protein